MTKQLAFSACYSDWKLIKTRGVVQVVMEVPLADSDAAYDVLGGMPNPANETWFGIAPIKLGKEAMPDTPREQIHPTKPGPDNARPLPDTDKRSAGAKRDWRDIPPPQRAGIRINEPTFAAYLRERHSDEWHETGEADACLKFICKIESKRDLTVNARACQMFDILDNDYQGWLAKERVGA